MAISVCVGIAILITVIGITPESATVSNYWFDGVRSPAYRTISAINGTLFGFTMTGFSISMTFAQLPAAARIKRDGQLSSLFNIFMRSIAWLGAGTLLALVAMFVDTQTHPKAFVPVIVLFVQCIAVARLLRCVWILHRISKLLAVS